MLNAFRPLLLIAAISLVAPVLAQDSPSAPPAAEPRNQREDAGQRVRQVERDGGRVLQAEPMQRGGRETYRIKVLTPEGRVRVLDEGRGRDARQPRDDGQSQARPGRFDGGRDERPNSASRDRDRQRQSAPEARRAEPAPEAGEPPRQAPRRGDGGRSRD